MELHASAPASGRASLRRDEVHLWWGRIEAVEGLDAARRWLSDEERGRSERFRSEHDARAFLFRRAFLRAVLARYTGREPGELRFTQGELGKPALAASGVDVHFNASRSGAWVLVGVASGRELGVDVERHDPRLDPEEIARLARRVLTRAEREHFRALAPGVRARAFIELWTRKEALLKALGTGLSRAPDTLEVGFARHLEEHLAQPFPCRCFALAAPAGFAASLVVAAEAHERLALEDRSARLEPGAPLERGASLERSGQAVLRSRTWTLVVRSRSSSVRSTRPGMPPTSE